MLDLLKALDARLGEPSTYAGLATMLVLLHINVAPGLWSQVTMWGTVGAAVAAVVLKEVGTKPGAQIAMDAVSALVSAVKALPENVGKTAAALLLVCVLPAIGLGACSTAQQAAVTNSVATLASVAAAHNTTAAALLSDGALVCGQASSVQGQLLEGSAVAILNAAGVPVSVTNQAASDVAAACSAIGLVAGPVPSGQTTLPVATVSTSLPAAT